MIRLRPYKPNLNEVTDSLRERKLVFSYEMLVIVETADARYILRKEDVPSRTTSGHITTWTKDNPLASREVKHVDHDTLAEMAG